MDRMTRKLRKEIAVKSRALMASRKDMQAICTVMFSYRDHVLCEGHDGYRTYKLTYGQIYDRICRAAAALYAKIGAGNGYVALEMDNCPDWIVAFWAILMSGNKPYLVNLRYPQSLTEGILKTLEAKHVLCLERSDLPGTVITMADLAGDYPAVPEDVFENEIAFSSSATSMKETVCFYTGKEITAQIMEFDEIVATSQAISKHYKGQLKQLAFLPFYHIFGLFAVYFWYTFFGRTLVFLKDYSADTILKTCRRHEVTHIFAVPMLWHTVEKQVWATAREQGKEKKLQTGLKIATAVQNLFPHMSIGPKFAKWLLRDVTDKLFGRSVTCCINGGSYLRDSAMYLLNGLGYSMRNGYGMSEIGITSVELRNRPKARNLNSIGRPFSAVEYMLQEDGELLVRGEPLCTRKLVNGVEQEKGAWFATGDIMRCDSKGNYFILGRKGDLVIGENGENINPDTVEKFFVLGSAKMLCVLGLPGESGEELSLVVQLNPYASEAGIAAIRDEAYAINQTLLGASAIKKFYFTFDELSPPTAVKVSRTQLLRKIESGQVELIPFGQIHANRTPDGATSAAMAQVKAIIAKVLELRPEAIGDTDHIFYDLGATSIQYFTIVGALSETFGIDQYDNGDSYRYTPAEICEYIERHI